MGDAILLDGGGRPLRGGAGLLRGDASPLVGDAILLDGGGRPLSGDPSPPGGHRPAW
ncbi:hypothetical protein ABZ400_06285 [Streptomyces sp. NPDC005897]|uniref:hypothetical protein n=1 Tax=Streptomyces sp. NPDC005897 TaxID=3157081 RepID=UPI0033C79D23